MTALPHEPGRVRIGLVLNERGWDRALTSGVDEANMAVCASDEFGIRNQGMTTAEQVATMVRIAGRRRVEGGPPLSVTISVAFGCPFEGEVPVSRVAEIARAAAEAGVAEIALADTIGAADPWAVRERIADWYVQSKGLEYTKFRTITALSRGQMPGPESSIYKIVSATKLQEVAQFALDLMDSAGMIADPAIAAMRAIFQQALLYSPGGRIAGGTDEILRNIIAERVLGLPGDIRVDRDKPFNQLPV